MRGLNPNPAVKPSRAALAFRTAHAAIALEQLLAIAYLWWCALSGRRDRLLHIAAATLIGEGVLVTQPLMAVPAFTFVEAFGPLLPYGIGFAAGAMTWMVFAELLPDVRREAPDCLVAVVALSVFKMLTLQILVR